MKNVITATLVLLLIGCGESKATDESNVTYKTITPESKLTTNTIDTFDESILTKPVEVNLDDMSFSNAFRIEYRAKGKGHTFWWRGEEYTTNLAETLDEFVLRHTTHNVDNLGSVLNNDDPDDNCKSNKLDDCGVCDGLGKTTWFRDKDKDGLGTFMEWITSCTYPTNVEIEKYQVESLQEFGGDQGR